MRRNLGSMKRAMTRRESLHDNAVQDSGARIPKGGLARRARLAGRQYADYIVRPKTKPKQHENREARCLATIPRNCVRNIGMAGRTRMFSSIAAG
jgi:hypothetical protein